MRRIAKYSRPRDSVKAQFDAMLKLPGFEGEVVALRKRLGITPEKDEVPVISAEEIARLAGRFAIPDNWHGLLVSYVYDNAYSQWEDPEAVELLVEDDCPFGASGLDTGDETAEARLKPDVFYLKFHKSIMPAEMKRAAVLADRLLSGGRVRRERGNDALRQRLWDLRAEGRTYEQIHGILAHEFRGKCEVPDIGGLTAMYAREKRRRASA